MFSYRRGSPVKVLLSSEYGTYKTVKALDLRQTSLKRLKLFPPRSQADLRVARRFAIYVYICTAQCFAICGNGAPLACPVP